MHPTQEKSKGPTVKLNDFARGKLGGACHFWYNKKWLGWAGGIVSKTGELAPRFEIYFEEGVNAIDVTGHPGEVLQDFDNDLKFINGTIYLVMGDHYFPDSFPSLYQNSWTTVIDKINNKTFQELYYEALKDDLIGACVYRKNVYYMSDMETPAKFGEPLRNITRLDLNGSKTKIETKGIPPRILQRVFYGLSRFNRLSCWRRIQQYY
ncbi:hypothetical protein DSO57_1027252 [Entomophthora muscae]|uniref:Uncharacterized protein n=1 Tax=Entomophthora muscae TaxID=34485 RepID=A0ACC2SEQ1_9FUNG|nr:hypothetical protein DSO57_1027252 [Entomophthora muscae]